MPSKFTDNRKTGLLINFNNTQLKKGIKRFVLCFLRALRALRGSHTLLEFLVGLGSVCHAVAAVGHGHPRQERRGYLPTVWLGG